MIKKGYRYEVLEDMYFTKVDEIVEINDTSCYSGIEYNVCFTSSDILQVIKKLTNLLNGGTNALSKGYEFEVIEIEYSRDTSYPQVITYIEFMVFIPYQNGFEVKQNSIGWGFIREDLLKKVGKNIVYKNKK